MNLATPMLSTKETMLAAIRKRRWIELETRGRKLFKPKLEERTNATGGIIHHLGKWRFGLCKVDI
jgi:hypothetical protein